MNLAGHLIFFNLLEAVKIQQKIKLVGIGGTYALISYLEVFQKLTAFPLATVNMESSLETSIPLGIEAKSMRWISFEFK